MLSSVTYGAADFLGGLGARRTSTLWVVVISQAAGLLLVLAAAPLLPGSLSQSAAAWGVVAGLTGGGGVALLYYALSIGVMSVVAPTTAVCAIAVPVIVGLALGERPAPAAVLGILLAVAAIILVSRTEGGERRVLGPSRSITIAIFSGILIGMFFVALERGGQQAGLWSLLAARIVSVSCFAFATLILRPARPAAADLGLITAAGLIDMLANILYVIAVRHGSLSIVATLASLYPASTVLLARLVLGERLHALQKAGVACAGVAIVLIVSSSA